MFHRGRSWRRASTLIEVLLNEFEGVFDAAVELQIRVGELESRGSA